MQSSHFRLFAACKPQPNPSLLLCPPGYAEGESKLRLLTGLGFQLGPYMTLTGQPGPKPVKKSNPLVALGRITYPHYMHDVD